MIEFFVSGERCGALIVEKYSVGRNDPCPCGSGKKYKKCHLLLEQGGAPTIQLVREGDYTKCSCEPVVLYWLKDAVWKQIKDSLMPPVQGNLQLCVECAEKMLRRQLTLHDLDIRNYEHSKGMPASFIKDYAKATLFASCREVGCTTPEGWRYPQSDMHLPTMEIGAKLARQTRDAYQLMPALIQQAESLFSTPT